MDEEQNRKSDLKIRKIRKAATILGIIALGIILCVLLFNLSYPNIWFSVLLTIAIPLAFISAGMFIATWIMDVRLAYKRKEFIFLAILIAGALVYILLNILNS